MLVSRQVRPMLVNVAAGLAGLLVVYGVRTGWAWPQGSPALHLRPALVANSGDAPSLRDGKATAKVASGTPSACIPADDLVPRDYRLLISELDELRAHLEFRDDATTYKTVTVEEIELALDDFPVADIVVDMVDCSSYPCVARFLHGHWDVIEQTLKDDSMFPGMILSASGDAPEGDTRPPVLVALWEEQPTGTQLAAVAARFAEMVPP